MYIIRAYIAFAWRNVSHAKLDIVQSQAKSCVCCLPPVRTLQLYNSVRDQAGLPLISCGSSNINASSISVNSENGKGNIL